MKKQLLIALLLATGSYQAQASYKTYAAGFGLAAAAIAYFYFTKLTIPQCTTPVASDDQSNNNALAAPIQVAPAHNEEALAAHSVPTSPSTTKAADQDDAPVQEDEPQSPVAPALAIAEEGASAASMNDESSHKKSAVEHVQAVVAEPAPVVESVEPTAVVEHQLLGGVAKGKPKMTKRHPQTRKHYKDLPPKQDADDKQEESSEQAVEAPPASQRPANTLIAQLKAKLAQQKQETPARTTVLPVPASTATVDAGSEETPAQARARIRALQAQHAAAATTSLPVASDPAKRAQLLAKLEKAQQDAAAVESDEEEDDEMTKRLKRIGAKKVL